MIKIKSCLKALIPSVRKPAVIYRHLLFIPFLVAIMTLPLWCPFVLLFVSIVGLFWSYEYLLERNYDKFVKSLLVFLMYLTSSLACLWLFYCCIPDILIGRMLLPQSLLKYFCHNHNLC